MPSSRPGAPISDQPTNRVTTAAAVPAAIHVRRCHRPPERRSVGAWSAIALRRGVPETTGGVDRVTRGRARAARAATELRSMRLRSAAIRRCRRALGRRVTAVSRARSDALILIVPWARLSHPCSVSSSGSPRSAISSLKRRSVRRSVQMCSCLEGCLTNRAQPEQREIASRQHPAHTYSPHSMQNWVDGVSAIATAPHSSQ